MDVSQLAILRELADRGSITDVAIATHKSPSAVSQQLKTLQRQVGVVLVERSGRGVRLTEAGHALAASSVRIATAIAEAEATWDEFRGGATGRVTVAIFPSAAELFVPGLLSQVAEHPAIELVIQDRDVSQEGFVELVRDVDIVVAHRSDDVTPPDRSALRIVPLVREPLDVAMPLRHPLASRAQVSIDDVIGEDWISVPADYPIDRVLQAMAAQSGVQPNVVFRGVHLPLIENLVTAGHGVALVPRFTSLTRATGRFALVPLANLRAGRHLEALLRPDRAVRPAVRVVLDLLVAQAQALG